MTALKKGDFARIKAILNPQYSKLLKDYLRFDEKDEEAQTIFHVVVRTGDANLIGYIYNSFPIIWQFLFSLISLFVSYYY